MAETKATHVHAHGCRQCDGRYEDTCDDNKSDTVCGSCRVGKSLDQRGLLFDNRRPKECCRDNSRPASKEEIKTYRLAGAHKWWICATCKRTHPFNPKEQ